MKSNCAKTKHFYKVSPDHGVVLVVGVVGVSQFSVGPELELEKLVAELALVADVVPQVEIVAHLLLFGSKM